jgi:hypothetical protein
VWLASYQGLDQVKTRQEIGEVQRQKLQAGYYGKIKIVDGKHKGTFRPVQRTTPVPVLQCKGKGAVSLWGKVKVRTGTKKMVSYYFMCKKQRQIYLLAGAFSWLFTYSYSTLNSKFTSQKIQFFFTVTAMKIFVTRPIYLCHTVRQLCIEKAHKIWCGKKCCCGAWGGVEKFCTQPKYDVEKRNQESSEKGVSVRRDVAFPPHPRVWKMEKEFWMWKWWM